MEKKKRFETNYDHHKSNSRKEKVEGGYVWVGGVGGGGACNRIFFGGWGRVVISGSLRIC